MFHMPVKQIIEHCIPCHMANITHNTIKTQNVEFIDQTPEEKTAN